MSTQQAIFNYIKEQSNHTGYPHGSYYEGGDIEIFLGVHKKHDYFIYLGSDYAKFTILEPAENPTSNVLVGQPIRPAQRQYIDYCDPNCTIKIDEFIKLANTYQLYRTLPPQDRGLQQNVWFKPPSVIEYDKNRTKTL